MDSIKIIGELQRDSEFMSKLQNAANLDEISELFTSRGISITTEEIEAILAVNTSEELDETALDDVSGGGAISLGIKVFFQVIPKLLPRIPSSPGIRPRIPRRK